MLAKYLSSVGKDIFPLRYLRQREIEATVLHVDIVRKIEYDAVETAQLMEYSLARS